MTDVNTENQTSPAGGGLPLRGLAMVLIAVALLLGLWGLYALTRDDADTTTATGGNGTATAPAEAGAGNDGAAPDASAPGGTAKVPGDAPGADRGADGEGADDDAPGTATAPGTTNPRAADDAAGDRAGTDRGAAAPAAAPGRSAPAPERLHILNNSTVPNLAADVSETMQKEGHDVGEVGNLPDDVEVLPENTVFFQPGNPTAEERARKLADRVDGVAREYIDTLPDGTAGANDLTLVLIGQVAI